MRPFLHSPILKRPTVDTKNAAGGDAYALSATQALAQYASTGCFGGTFYAGGQEQLDKTLELARKVHPQFVAKCAIYARKHGRLKDMPALLCAYLSTVDSELFRKTFKRVINNGRMLRKFVELIRAGVVGRKSLGSAPKKAVEEWLASRSDQQIFYDSVGNKPSLADIIKMVHPEPETKSRSLLYRHLVGKEVSGDDWEALPKEVRNLNLIRNLPDRSWVTSHMNGLAEGINFQMLTSMTLDAQQWTAIARNAPWTMLRMNLNTFARHGVFNDPDMVRVVARRLSNLAEVAEVKPLPYEIMAAIQNVGPTIPREIYLALETALEASLANVPEIQGKIFVCPDISGSMSNPITGRTALATTTTMRCVDVAALFTAALIRRNPSAGVLPFNTHVVPTRIHPANSLSVNAKLMAELLSGGTSCSAPVDLINRSLPGPLNAVIIISDNMSWHDLGDGKNTPLMAEWEKLKRQHPNARLVCIDLTPNANSQACERSDVLRVGGFSSAVFDIVADFANEGFEGGNFVRKIESIDLDVSKEANL